MQVTKLVSTVNTFLHDKIFKKKKKSLQGENIAHLRIILANNVLFSKETDFLLVASTALQEIQKDFASQ